MGGREQMNWSRGQRAEGPGRGKRNLQSAVNSEQKFFATMSYELNAINYFTVARNFIISYVPTRPCLRATIDIRSSFPCILKSSSLERAIGKKP